MKDSDSNIYWATEEPNMLARHVMTRWREWRAYFVASGMAAKADKGRRYMYGLNDLAESSSRLQVGGQQAQFLKVVVNHIRVLVQRSMAMLGAQEPTMTPVAANSDADAREQAISARGILEHVHREHNTEAKDDAVLKIAMHSGEAFRLILWDANKGEPTAVDPETEQPTARQGDFANAILTPFDLARDPSAHNWEALRYVIARTFENKWELAAQWPEKREEIIMASRGMGGVEMGAEYDNRVGDPFTRLGDFVAVYRLFHVDGAALPRGRVFTCLNEQTWLEDGPNPYKGLPVERMTPDPVTDTTLGYSNVFDALGVSDLLNALHTVFATNAIRWGPGTLAVEEGSGIQHSTLSNGTGVLTVKRRPDGQVMLPVPLEPPQTSPEAYKYAEMIQGIIVETLGMNSTAMGTPPFSGMAAQAMALMDQKAREFNDGLAKSQKAYKQGCATKELQILKAFAKDERMAIIQGKAKTWMLKSFTGNDLAKVDRVAMEATPPGTGSLAWKFGQVQALADMGVQLPAEAVIELLRTGQMESAFEYPEANRLRIKAENEGLQEGRMPPVIVARTHWLDIPEHLALLSSPDVTLKPEVVEAVMSTVEAKLDAWRSLPRDIAMMLGEPPELRAMLDQTMAAIGEGAPVPPDEAPAAPEPLEGPPNE